MHNNEIKYTLINLEMLFNQLEKCLHLKCSEVATQADRMVTEAYGTLAFISQGIESKSQEVTMLL